ncbi:MAG: hypothetical protein RR668_05555, partial [Algoriella sp.]
LKSKLLTYGEPFDLVKLDITSALKSIFKLGDLELGFSIYNSETSLLENSPLQHMTTSLLLNSKNDFQMDEVACVHLENKISKSDYYVISNVDSMLEKQPEDKLLKIVSEKGYKSLILYPLKNGDDCLGILEIASKKSGVFNRVNANLLREFTPLLEESIYRYSVEFENQINAYIQTEYTSLHPSVDWKFREKAREHLVHITN